MCGIIGISEGNRDIEEGMKALKHRGPDDRGVFSNNSVTFGHHRLSIIDLSHLGHQPMVFEGFVISFNGEIYNYQELKEYLIKKGIKFIGSSDTEVILQGFILEGNSFLEKLRGMWALAIYNVQKNEILLARDHFGIKPLYYTIQNNKLYFASEIKALKKIIEKFSPNTEKYYQFYNLGYFIGEDTCYKEIKKVLPGGILIWNLKNKLLQKEFIPLESAEKKEINFNQSVEIVNSTILDSVEKHYIADVEVGLLLSGGTDSSLLAAISKKIGKNPTCYHVSIPGSIDTEYARKVAANLDLDLVEKELSSESLVEEYEDMKNWLDLPTSDVSVIPTSLVYKSINKESKVVLSGEGGDELFGGYLRHQYLSSLNEISLNSDSLNSFYSSSNIGLNIINPTIRRLQEKFSTNIIDAYLHNTKTIGFPIEAEKIKKDLLLFYTSHRYRKFTPKNLFFDQFMYLPDSLMYKNDITSMYSSIEARVPLVDKEVLRVASSVRDKFRLSREFQNKQILKTILKKYLPDDLVDRPKKGFGFSFETLNKKLFVDDYKKAAKFHVANAKDFAITKNLSSILSESKAELICKKFPRFAFSLITNCLVMKDL